MRHDTCLHGRRNFYSSHRDRGTTKPNHTGENRGDRWLSCAASCSRQPQSVPGEFRLGDADDGEFEKGGELKVDLFEEGQKVDVIGTSIGKGYAGTVKRHNFSMQDATHGNSLAHRAPGSIGQNQTPGRVFKGKKMSGQMGNVRRTVQNLEIVRVDADRNVLLIKGAVPGHAGGKVIVRPAIKARK
jgi:large subunit ribosomal protein L3